MKPGLKGNKLPESYDDFKVLESEGGLRFHGCVRCCDPFHFDNTHTAAGWSETQISGMCEDCFDNLFEEKL